MKPDEEGLIERIYAAIPKNVKAAFISCFLAGFLVHLYVFTNMIPNFDGLSRVYDEQQMTVSGRWFLHYASMLHGYIQAPALIGGLSLLFLAVSAGLCVDMLKIRGLGASILCGCFLSLTPAMAYTYLYTFTASAYAFGILLAVFSVWLTRRFRWGWLTGAFSLAASIGTYQAYLSVAAALALICTVSDILDHAQDIFLKFRRSIVMLGSGLVLYAAILSLFLAVKDLELLDYQAISTVPSVSGLLRSSVSAYAQFFKYFLIFDSVSYITRPITLTHIVLFLAAFISLIKHKPNHPVLLSVVLLCFPLACNLTRLLSESTPVTLYAFVFPYILALLLTDRTEYRWLYRCFCSAGLILLLLFSQICNIAYTTTDTAHRATQAFATNLAGRVESTPGYENGMEVIVIGSFPDDVYYSTVDGFALVEHYSCLSSSVIPLNKHIYYYMNDWLNIPWQEPEESLMIEIADSEEFQSMALYPSDGSVRIIDGRVVVKLAETYTPKKDYEIAYENRR